ncbi:hypothetical protein BKA61DRAFT_620970 [Leptodontidium sp. MPI-SDFR-AT-0119]|nr:hypothetical protein BKA61DRAFT_620970 [Leptodontidium sp. MPI-SDFR-AT-0119]
MEEAIQSLLRQAVRALCGGSDSNDDQLKEEIANISRTGINGHLESNDFVFVRVRKSNRLKSSAQKRQFDNLEGLTSPCKRKRKSFKSTTSANKDTTVKTPAAVNKSSADVDTEVGTPSIVDEPGAEAAAESEAVGAPAAVDKPSNDAAIEDTSVGTPAVVDEPGTNAATEDTAGGTPPGHTASASSEVMTDSSQSSSQSTPLRPWTSGSITDNSRPESSSTTENAQIAVQLKPLHSCPLSTVADLLNPEHANRVAASVLLECVNRHYKIGPFGGRTDKVTSTTNMAKIRAFTKELASLEYEAAVHSIAKRNAMHAANGIQIGSDENAYWEIILKGVKVLDPATLPKGAPKGPLDGFSAAEKAATENFMKSASFGTSPENQRQCRGLWKTLFDIRKAGVEMITCYRTAEFNQYCKTYSRRSDISLVDTIVSWEKVYGPQIAQLEDRVLEHRRGDFSGKSRLMQKHVAERLQVAESSWNEASNEWYSSDEEAAFKLATTVNATSSKSLASLFNDRANTQQHQNKALFISLLPNGDSRLDVCPTIPVYPGDFLGIYSGTIRFSENSSLSHGIPGPESKLWLDYSQVTGTFNQMQVSKPGGDANVHLRWEAVNEQDETGPCESWRVLVIASKAIMPFEPLVRAAPRNEQYLLHQRLGFANRGFMKSALVTKLKA